MSHSPPIPPGNVSPYPITEQPHAAPKDARSEPSVAPPIPEQGVLAELRDQVSPKMLGTAGAVAAGLVALVVAGRTIRAKRAATTDKGGRTGKTTSSRKSAPASDKSAAPATPKKRGRPAPSDNKNDRGPQDASRVALGEEYEVRYWTKKFGVGRVALKRAVAAVGNGADAVERELKKG